MLLNFIPDNGANPNRACTSIGNAAFSANHCAITKDVKNVPTSAMSDV